MKWLKRKLRKWIQDADREYLSEASIRSRDEIVKPISDSHCVDGVPVLNFRIFGAQNGLILEFTSYNEKTDRRNNSTYIISESEDVADFVRQSLPIEMLKVQQ